ncbi:MAG: HAD hydrolase-like protein, partial [Deltaproteobacteria bacterium]|nr:HAD hydrolase-like protein [Deltaproteobacteria bacterium]
MHHEPPSLSLVVFDLDGTLVDSRGDIVAAANEALADLGLAPLDETTMGAFVGDGASALMHRAAEASLARSGRTVSAADLDTLGRRGV